MRAVKGNFGIRYFLLVAGILLYCMSLPVSSAVPPRERAALAALYNSTNGDHWINNSGWKTPPLDVDGFALPGTENTWYGVTCDSGNTTVQIIYMYNNRLDGAIPPALGNLANLQLLDLHANQLRDSIPPELGNLANLQLLYLSYNDLSGSIPPELGDLANLQKLFLTSNFLSGSIPPELGNLANLQSISLTGNQLSGTIPPELGSLANLQGLSLYFNQLRGSIPPELGNLANLQLLNLHSNQLSGTIPPELGNLANLQYFWLSFNQLSGGIPPELGNLANLLYLSINYNQLSGGIPPELGNLVNLQQLSLHYNQLSGGIPAELGNLANLQELSLHNNQLSGGIPAELGNLANLEVLFLHSNQLSGSITSNLTNLMNLRSNYLDLRWNAIYTNDETLRIFLNSKQYDGNWESTQTTAPTNVCASALSSSAIRVSWDPIPYTADTGGYRVYYSAFSAGPYTYSGMTADKYESSFDVTGLNAAATYYLVVKTQTDPHDNNDNTVVSDYSEQASTTTNFPGPTHTLTVQSSPDTGAIITVIPNDNSGNGNGTTNFTRTYDEGTEVTLTAPASHNGKYFSKWKIDGVDNTNPSIQVTMDISHGTTAYYAFTGLPEILLDRSDLNFASVVGGNVSPSQELMITAQGGPLNWTAAGDASWLYLSPSSGTGSAVVTVTVNPSWMAAGTYTGTITVSSPHATNSPQTVGVTLEIYNPGSTAGPFGAFETPIDDATVMSSIAVTGWALDDIGVERVKIYRGAVGNFVYIGDAVFVDGARPDVEEAYPRFPMNYRAGWGYMLLTNLLPDGGNGKFKLNAMATDTEGNTVTLGTKTIICDNANAVKPFGAIDTPGQGGTASGSDFVNWGWVLTPQPNYIPTDVSTINVWVDGVNLGHPKYNIYRRDVDALFPGNANSNGAGGYFYLDTTTYKNGVHTIQWTATDSGGNTDGIGSRYFTILNTGGASTGADISIESLKDLPVDSRTPISIRKGFQKDIEPQEIYPGHEGQIKIEARELERVELDFSNNTIGTPQISGYMLVSQQLRPLPVGSTLDSRASKFYWQPGPGFMGEYWFIFIIRGPKGGMYRKNIIVEIVPGFE